MEGESNVNVSPHLRGINSHLLEEQWSRKWGGGVQLGF